MQHVLSKDCSFKDISAEKYWKDLVRDAFINGLTLHHIHQQLLENNKLSVNEAFNEARVL